MSSAIHGLLPIRGLRTTYILLIILHNSPHLQSSLWVHYVAHNDGAVLSLALTYSFTISNQVFGYIMWTSGDVESYVRL